MMDTPETFAAALIGTTVTAAGEARRIVQRGAQNIKTDWKNNVAQTAPHHGAAAARHITYDTKVLPTTVVAEIGYDKMNKAARLGNLLEFGGGGDHSPPHRDGGRALEVEEPRFVTQMELLAGRLL